MASNNATFDMEASEAILMPFRRLALAAIVAMGYLLFCWMVTWYVTFKLWPADGIYRLEDVLQRELKAAVSMDTEYIPVSKIAVGISNSTYDAIFGFSGLHDMGVRFQQGTYPATTDQHADRLYAQSYEWIHAAMVSTQIAGLRFGMLLSLLPLGALFYFIAFSDGIVERAIRRDCGGRESATIYHRAKYTQVTCTAFFTLLYFAWPYQTAYPGAVITMLACIALLARIQWSYYKKYL